MIRYTPDLKQDCSTSLTHRHQLPPSGPWWTSDSCTHHKAACLKVCVTRCVTLLFNITKIYGMFCTNHNPFILSLTLLYKEGPFARSWPPSRWWRWSAAPLPPSGPCGGRRLRGLIIKQHVLKFVLHVTPLFNITKITRPHAFMHEQPAARETQTIWKL